jgi:putative ABC transport system substrate-binding protein
MHRRLLLQAALAAPFAAPSRALAQPAEGRHRIGLLLPGDSAGPTNVPTFIEALREMGYEEGRNLVIERRYAGTSEERLVEHARDLVKEGVEIIVAAGPSATRAAREATATVPIVMGNHDPVEQGLVASLARPGGNVTGWSMLSVDMAQKQLAILKEAIPRLARVAVVANPEMAGHALRSEALRKAARDVGLELAGLDVAREEAIAPAFATMRREGIQAFFVVPDPRLDGLRASLVRQAEEARMPGMYTWRLYVAAGGLMSYGPSLPQMVRRWAHYVDKILKGARPAELPIEAPRKYELVLNQRSARALGFTFPGTLLLAADEVIS